MTIAQQSKSNYTNFYSAWHCSIFEVKDFLSANSWEINKTKTTPTFPFSHRSLHPLNARTELVWEYLTYRSSLPPLIKALFFHQCDVDRFIFWVFWGDFFLDNLFKGIFLITFFCPKRGGGAWPLPNFVAFFHQERGSCSYDFSFV